MIRRRSVLATTAAALAAPRVLRAQPATKISFYYPIAVGGPIPAIIDGYCRDFRAQSGIEVSPVYAGNYADALTKAVAALKAGAGPQFAILLAAEIHTLRDLDILLSVDELAGADFVSAAASTFFPAFLANSRDDGKLWSLPFQRSTAIAYYNKQAFTEAGLDADRFPRTWAELSDAASKLTKRDAGGRVTRWGFKLASDLGNAQWTFGALAWQAGHVLMNEAGTEVYFNHPKAIEAMAFWRSLAFEAKATPEGITPWPQLSPDFLEANAAIIQHTTGNLTNVRDKAQFPFGVAGLPGKEAPRTVVGGGNLYFFRTGTKAEQEAALKFAQFLTTPERAADWCMRTGYIATRPDAWQTPALTEYVQKFPAAGVAKDYLPQATGELSTYENQRVYKALTDQIQACLSGKKTPAQAMADAQAESERILRPFRRT
jgi:sn-glycerol 3-phosphate transport system substrate-binding protein